MALTGAALLLASSAATGAACWAWGRASGAAAALSERCRGEAVRETAGGGVACSFWIREPGREGRR